MSRRRILSPMPMGNGAYVVHQNLASRIDGYRVAGFHPLWELAPYALPVQVSFRNVDLIHTVADYGIFYRRKSIPLVVSFQNYVLDRWMRTYSSPLQRLHYMLDLRLWTHLSVRHAVAITAASRFTARLARSNLGIERPVRVIYNGIDTDHFRPGKRAPKSGDEIRVFFSGNLTRRKGAQWLSEIARRLPKNVRIYYTLGLRTRKSLPTGSNLKSVGSVAYVDMPDRYREMDILLMPTVREGFGLCVAEAMACELPVVASDCSSIPELVDHGQGGFLCPVGDVEAFADAIRSLADNPGLRAQMGAYNRLKAVRHFSLEEMVDQYQRLFGSILDKETAPP